MRETSPLPGFDPRTLHGMYDIKFWTCLYVLCSKTSCFIETGMENLDLLFQQAPSTRYKPYIGQNKIKERKAYFTCSFVTGLLLCLTVHRIWSALQLPAFSTRPWQRCASTRPHYGHLLLIRHIGWMKLASSPLQLDSKYILTLFILGVFLLLCRNYKH